MFDESTLNPHNRYKFVETVLPHEFGPEVTILKANNNSYRFCHNNDQNDVLRPFDGCLIVGYDRVINSVYTTPSKRRRGIAKQLLLIAKLTLNTVYYSDDLTTSGRLWRDSVEAI